MKIYIIGANGFGKEIALLAKQIGYSIEGFIDVQEKDDIKLGDLFIPVIEENKFIKENKVRQKEVNLAIGLGDPKVIEKIATKFKGFNFPNLIHSSAQFDFDFNEIGVGNIITSNVVFTIGIRIGDFNVFNLSSTVGHDTTIGSFNVINPLVAISGGVQIGESNLLGVSSTVLQDISIGSYNTIGASSLITKNVDNDCIMVGVPAKNRNG